MGSELGPEKRRGKSLFLPIRQTAPGSPRINIVRKNKGQWPEDSLLFVSKEGWEGGKNRARGKRWEGEREDWREAYVFLSSHRPLPAYYFFIIAGASAEERDLRTKVKIMVIGLSRLQFGLQSYERQITSMITDRIGRNEVLLPINHNYNKICGV